MTDSGKHSAPAYEDPQNKAKPTLVFDDLRDVIHISAVFDDLQIDMNEIYLNLGYKGNEPDGHTLETLDKIIADAAQICKPEAMMQIYPCRLKGSHLMIADVEMHTGRVIANYLTDTSEVAVFVVTAGKAFDDYLHKIKTSSDIYTEFLADAVGSELAEATVRLVSRQLEQFASERGMFITLSYSPGYCGWHVREQPKLFSLLPDQPCGVKLNDSCLMSPVKSVSGIIGLSHRPDVQVPYSCEICGLETCYKRKSS
jgi:cobalamin-dependent methionine synthase I